MQYILSRQPGFDWGASHPSYAIDGDCHSDWSWQQTDRLKSPIIYIMGIWVGANLWTGHVTHQ